MDGPQVFLRGQPSIRKRCHSLGPSTRQTRVGAVLSWHIQSARIQSAAWPLTRAFSPQG